MESWPLSRALWMPAEWATIWSRTASNWLRLPKRSKAPALIRHSSARLLTWRRSTRSAEVLQAGEGAAFLACGDDDRDRPFAHILDGGHAKADGAALGHGEGVADVRVAVGQRFRVGRALLDVEIQAAVVDVRRQHVDAHAPAFVDEVDDLLGLVPLDQQQRRHVLDRIVGLEVGRLHGDDRVVGGVAVVDQDVVGDEVVGARHFQIVGLFLADVLNGDDLVPVDVAVTVATQLFAAEVISQSLDRPAIKAVLADGACRIEFTLCHAAVGVQLLSM